MWPGRVNVLPGRVHVLLGRDVTVHLLSHVLIIICSGSKKEAWRTEGRI